MYNFNHQLPFVLSVIWLLVAAVVSTASLPDFPNVAQADKKPFDVLKMFKPKEVEREGKTVKDWSLVFLGLGAGLSILATGYGDVELDLVGMNNFAFTPQEMGNLIVSHRSTGLTAGMAHHFQKHILDVFVPYHISSHPQVLRE